VLAELVAQGFVSADEVHQKMKTLGYKRRITKKDIEDGLKESGCTAAQLFMLNTDAMGMTLLDLILLDDSLPSVLEVFNKLDLEGTPDESVDQFAANLFRNLSSRLRKNNKLRSMMEFIQSLKNYPQMS
jgi:hypothetical protein